MKRLYHRLPKSPKRRIVLTVLLFLSMTVVQDVMAHTRVELGPYAVVVGWLQEPVIVGERNAIIVEVTENELPVTGVEATLDMEVLYAGSNFRTNINPTETPGLYTAPIYPTFRGQYQVRLFGQIDELAVDEIIEPEEVFPASRLQFPEAEPDLFTLQVKLVDLESQLQSARTLAWVGVGIGLFGLALAFFSLLNGRKKG